MITLLNTSILTTYGQYIYQPIDINGVFELVQPIEGQQGFDSAIGHQSTAEILTELLGVNVAVNRQTFVQQPNSHAVVFKLNARVPEGKILNRAEIEEIGYEFGLLTRLA